MAQGKLSAFTKIDKKEAPLGPSEGPAIGSGSKGGETLSTLDSLKNLGKMAGNKVAGAAANRGFSALMDYLAPQTQNDVQGSDPNAYAQQRQGERQDYTPQGQPAQGVPSDVSLPNPNVWTPGNATEGATTVDPSSIFSEAPISGVGTGATGGGAFSELGDSLAGVGSQASEAGSGALSGLANISPYSIPGLLMSIVSPFIKQDRDNQMLQQNISGALTAATSALTMNPWTAVLASAINTGMGIYGDIEGKKPAGNIAANAIARSSPWGLVGGEGMTESIDNAFLPSEAWRNFTRNLGTNEGQQGKGFSILQQALPYVQSKEELGELLNTMKNYVTTTTGAPLTGGREDIYGVQTIPGTSGYEHGTRGPTAGNRTDWGDTTSAFQRLIDQYQGMLPGQPLTDPNLRLSGEAGSRLWNQFIPRDVAPTYVPKDIPGMDVSTGAGEGSGSVTSIPGVSAGFHAPNETRDISSYTPGSVLSYGDPGYQYTGSPYGDFPEPGKNLGTVNPSWNALLASSGFGSLGTNSSPGAPAGPGSAGGQKSNLQGTLGFAGLTGPLNEIRGGDNPNQI